MLQTPFVILVGSLVSYSTQLDFILYSRANLTESVAHDRAGPTQVGKTATKAPIFVDLMAKIWENLRVDVYGYEVKTVRF